MENVEWVKCEELKNLPQLCKGGKITKWDILDFVRTQISNYAARFNISYEHMSVESKYANSIFNSLIDGIFMTGHEVLTENSKEFKLLCDNYLIPIKEERKCDMQKPLEELGPKVSTGNEGAKELKHIQLEINSGKVDDICLKFEELNKSEQIAFLLYLEKSFSIKLSLEDIFTIFKQM